MASSTRSAFSTDFSVMMRLGRKSVPIIATARRPLASAARSRSEWTAGMAAVPGKRHAERFGDGRHGARRAHHRAAAGGGGEIALDVLDVRAAKFRRRGIWPRSAGNRCRRRAARRGGPSAASARRSAGWPAGRPRRRPSEAPARSCRRRRSAPPRPWAGRGSFPPRPSPSGCGTSCWWDCRKTSPSEMVGKSSGRPPAAMTPRLTASTSSGKCRWQLLKPLADCAMPTIGRDSISAE